MMYSSSAPELASLQKKDQPAGGKKRRKEKEKKAP
jgi:hypothetical protein